MNYEELQIQNADLNMKEMDLSEVPGLKGLYYNGNIAIEKKLTQNQKACVECQGLPLWGRCPVRTLGGEGRTAYYSKIAPLSAEETILA